MEEKVFINRELVPLSRALIPVDDRAVLFGDSAFETLRGYGGFPFKLRRHRERLAESCRMLRREVPLPAGDIEAAVADLLEQNNLNRGKDARIRITVTGGPAVGPKGLRHAGAAGIFITARPYDPPSPDEYRDGVSLAVSGIKRNSSSPLSHIKSGNYLDSLFARQEALDRGDDDAVMLTTAGNLSEATSSNIFYSKDGVLFTPNMGCGFLPGITRETVIELTHKVGIGCTLVTEGPENLLKADEAFLTNSMFELMPVRRAGSHDMPCCPGPLTERLHAAYRELVAHEKGVRHLDLN
jgi:branched-subunit amino acid aminotransferase/4-amino-4-deoxychorismate lyase